MGKFFKVVGIIAVVFIVLIVGAIAFGLSTAGSVAKKIGEQNSASLVSTMNSLASATSTQSSKQAEVTLADFYKIGDIVKIGDYQFTLNSFTDNVDSGNQFIVPKPGNKFVKVNLTIENQGAKKTSVSTSFQMYIKDGEGTKYNESYIGDQKSVDGELLAGDKIKGDVVYQVATSATGLKFYYNADFLFGKSIVIKLQ